MTLPTAISARAFRSEWWIEVEGWPYAVGTFDADATFFASRMAAEQFDGVKGWLKREDGGAMRPPDISAATIDHLKGRARTASIRVPLVDRDGATLHALTGTLRYDGWLRLRSDVTNAAASWTVDGDYGSWPASGRAYCGRECVGFTRVGQTLTVTRGALRTQQAAHLGKGAGGLSERRGAIVTQYPRSVVGRRCWLRLWTGTSATAAPDDTTAMTLFSGRITSYAWTESGHVLALECDDAQALMRASVGGEWFASHTLFQDGGSSILVADVPESGAGLATLAGSLPSRAAAADYSDFRWFTAGAEIMGCKGVAADIALQWLVERRGVLTGMSQAHPAGSRWHPTYIVADPALAAYSDFVSGHPLHVLLGFLLSTGTRTIDSAGVITAGGNGTYDTLPAGMGLGLPASDVDETGIAALADATPGLSVAIPLWAPIPDFRAWAAENLLKPFGFYLTAPIGGALTVRQMRAATVTETTNARALTLDDVVLDPGSGLPLVGDATADESAIVRSAKWSDSPVLRPGPRLDLPEGASVTFPDDYDFGDVHSAGESVEVKALGLACTVQEAVGDGFRIAGMPGRAPDSVRNDWIGRVGYRFTSPAVTFDVGLSLAWLDLAPGDLVSVTLPNYTNAASSTRGLSAEVCEVWGVKVDLARGVLTATLAQTNIAPSGRRNIAPCVDIASHVGATLTFGADPQLDASGFVAGQKVRMYSADLATRSSVATIQSVGVNLVLVADPGDLPASGYLMLADYGESNAAEQAAWAFRAGNDELLATSTAPHGLG